MTYIFKYKKNMYWIISISECDGKNIRKQYYTRRRDYNLVKKRNAFLKKTQKK